MDTLLQLLEKQKCYDELAYQVMRKVLADTDTETQNLGVQWKFCREWQSQLKPYFRQSPLALFKKRVQHKKGYLHLYYEDLAKIVQLMQQYDGDPCMESHINLLLKKLKLVITKKRLNEG